MLAYIFVFFAMTSAALGQVTEQGQCAPVNVTGNFSIPRYGGLWYEIKRFIQVFEPGMDCVTANYTLQLPRVLVHNVGVVNKTRFVMDGYAVQANSSSDEAKLLVTFPTQSNGTSPYWVLATNYDSYSLVYSCRDLANNMRAVSSWMLSRTNTLKPADEAEMNKVIQATNVIKPINYRVTLHTTEACNSATTQQMTLAMIVISSLLAKLL